MHEDIYVPLNELEHQKKIRKLKDIYTAGRKGTVQTAKKVTNVAQRIGSGFKTMYEKTETTLKTPQAKKRLNYLGSVSNNYFGSTPQFGKRSRR